MTQFSYAINKVTTIDVQFEGTQAIAKSQHHVDVIVAYHKNYECHEIITHDPHSGYEAPRLYLNTAVIQRQLDNIYVAQATDALAGKYQNARKPNTLARIQGIVEKKALLSFLLARIQLLQTTIQINGHDKTGFVVKFDLSNSPLSSPSMNNDNVVIDVTDLPAGFQPLVVSFRKNNE